jgi:HSP90 family molecular chaperone
MSISEEDDNFDIVNPKASNMIEALRDIGYSLESAVADIIDNSISADATRIDIRFGLAEERQEVPWLAIADNGSGMSDVELVEAMRPGGRDPLAKRKSDDLGRFGLGLKTASFSQCRKITVVSRKDGATSARQWDLDFVRTCSRSSE